jgi:NAD(P)-dependent dehydrogenase (short-subunit alcohol dehydrogenase family)
LELSSGAVSVNLSGKVALITGGGHGLGRTLARRYSAAGANVFITGRADEALVESAQLIRKSGGRAEWSVADVSKPEDVTRSFEEELRAFGTVDILVNNAGIAGPTADLVDLSVEDWNEVLAVNLTGPFLCCKAAIPIMRDAGGGKIVNIGSASGKRPLAGRTPYTASKLGLLGLTRTLAHEVGKYGINVNLVSPFLVAGPRLDLVIERLASARSVDAQVVRSEMTALSPFTRGVTEDDVANVALFLSSSAADNMTGQDINVSAGSVMY